MMIKQHKFKNIYTDGKRLYTLNAAPSIRFFEEKTIQQDGKEYRQWDPRKSKLAAAIMKGIKEIGFSPDSKILYLGASHGYTPSFISDIADKGVIFAVDFAPRVVRDLVFLSEKRKNLIPIIGDANQPETYANKVIDADFIYQDIAQKNQAGIFLKNIKMFLKPKGFAFLCVKSRSIDIAKKPRQVFSETRQMLEKELEIIDYKELEPFEMDHCVFLCRKR
ncbi:MAG: fibrillarin-like rRNA/tRNA 2'-O-methyltransferase [Candidatus Woesearchaeota archaeon]|nr:fibrillarin-like rRNA/tRNA 2'-O-methyltransferase [Candidatus Woesearchaeota archaeon]